MIQDSLMCGITNCCYKHRPLVDAVTLLHVEMLKTLDTPAVVDAKAGYWSKTTIFPQLGGPRRNIATFGKKNTEWQGYLTVKKS